MADLERRVVLTGMREGDLNKWTQFVQNKTPHLIQKAERLVGDDPDAVEEVVQEGIVSLYLDRARINPDSTYNVEEHRVFASARNYQIVVAEEQAHSLLTVSDLPSYRHYSSTDPADLYIDAENAATVVQVVTHTVAKLPPKQQEVFWSTPSGVTVLDYAAQHNISTEAIGQLSNEQRVVFNTSTTGGSVADYATQKGIPRTTAETSLRSARGKIENTLGAKGIFRTTR